MQSTQGSWCSVRFGHGDVVMQMVAFSLMQLMEVSPAGTGTWILRGEEWLFAGGLARLPDVEGPVGGRKDHRLQP